MASKKGGKAPAPKGGKATGTPVAPQAPVSTAVAATQYYSVSAAGAKYSPRSTTLQGNAASWQVAQAYLQANGGRATLQALQAHLAQQRNHANFAKYAIRRGWLVATK